jgi:hypothetical protein
MLILAVIWIVVSTFWLDTSWSKVAELRAAGMYVNPLRYGQIAFWVLVAGFWSWNGWRSWQSSKRPDKQENVV